MPADGYTPGPWEVARNAWGSGFYVMSDSKQICGVNQRLAGISEDEAHANARLIAASPALLAACEAAVEATGGSAIWNGETKRFLEMCEVAIKAAKGTG